MPNTILTPNVIANEALMVLKNNLVMANLVHRDYEDEFVKVGDTVTARRPSKFVAKNFTGAVDPQDLNEGGVPVKMDRLRDVTVQITSKEMSLDLRDFSAQVIEPAMTAIASAVDADVLATAVEGAGRTVTASGESATKPIKDIAKVGSYLDFAGVPVQNRRLVLNPSHKVLYATDDNLSKVSYAGDGNALRDAELGKVYTMDTYMSQNAPYPYGYLDNAVGTAKTYKVSGTAGESKVALSSVTAATATVKKGDCFIVDGYVYHFAAGATAASGAVAEVAIDQPLHATLSGKDATVISAPTSVGFHRNGVALVTRPMDLPMGNKNAYYLNATDISAGRLSGIEILADKGTIAGWNIDEDALYCDVGNNRAYFQKPSKNSDWVLSVQKKNSDGSYTGVWGVTMAGNMWCNGSLNVAGQTTFDTDVTFHKKIYDFSGCEIINAASGGSSLVIGYGQYDKKWKTYLEGGTIYLRHNGGGVEIQNGTATRFKLCSLNWTLDGSEAVRDTIESAGGFVLSANGGDNRLYLVGSSIYLSSNTTVKGNVVARGDVKLNFKAVSGTVPLVVNTSGVITTASSSARYKENIKPLEDPSLDPIGLYDVQVSQYNYKPECRDKELVGGTQIGLVAEDLAQHYPNAVIYDEDGRPESWQDRIMIPAMLKLIQEQKQQLDDLQAEVDALKAKLQ